MHLKGKTEKTSPAACCSSVYTTACRVRVSTNCYLFWLMSRRLRFEKELASLLIPAEPVTHASTSCRDSSFVRAVSLTMSEVVTATLANANSVNCVSELNPITLSADRTTLRAHSRQMQRQL